MVKRTLLIVLVIFLFSTLELGLAESDIFSIRNGISFGMTKEEVKQLETAKLGGEDQPGSKQKFLDYKPVEIAGIENCTLEYIFENEKLAEVTYLFPDTPGLIQKDIFSRINLALTEKYGTPLGNKNGETSQYCSFSLSFYIDMAKRSNEMDNMFGNKPSTDIDYNEWLLDYNDGLVKIETIYYAPSGEDASLYLKYCWFSKTVDGI